MNVRRAPPGHTAPRPRSGRASRTIPIGTFSDGVSAKGKYGVFSGLGTKRRNRKSAMSLPSKTAAVAAI
jgi:hypothetical protein